MKVTIVEITPDDLKALVTVDTGTLPTIDEILAEVLSKEDDKKMH